VDSRAERSGGVDQAAELGKINAVFIQGSYEGGCGAAEDRILLHKY
jgi:hypothetical protein